MIQDLTQVKHKVKYGKLTPAVTAAMVEDMLFDPILAAKVLLGVRLPPHEELRVLWMWTKQFTCDDSGFSTGKSWTLALVSALRSILMPHRVSGIISKSFRQGKNLFSNFDRWYLTSKIFRSCIQHKNGKSRLVHDSEVWRAHFRGGSEIRVLPPNWLQDAEQIRGERWNDGYFDEWTVFGNFKAFNNTVIGRVTNINHFPNCPVRQNHIHLASTTNFKHHPSYKMVENIDHQIAIGNKDYSRFTCNYRHIPDTPQWRWMVNRKVIYHMQTHNPKGVVESEIDGRWSDSSGSYYSSFYISKVRRSYEPYFKRTNQLDIFIGAFDTARGGTTTDISKSGDDFSLSFFRMVPGEWHPHHALTVRKYKVTDTQMSGIVHKWQDRLGSNVYIFDPGGGGLFVRDKLKLSEQLIEGEKQKVVPLTSMGDISGVLGLPIVYPFSRAETVFKQMWGKMQSDSILINRAHKEFRAAIESGRVTLFGEWAGWECEGSGWNVTSKRNWLNQNYSALSEEDLIRAEMDLAVSQLIQVDVERDENKMPKLDSYGQYKFESKVKKDSAYSLLYAYVGCLLYQELNRQGITFNLEDDNNDMAIEMQPI